ncbi:MAG: T6SS immunity protein Tli4 family protein [Pseudomonadota bacterium]
MQPLPPRLQVIFERTKLVCFSRFEIRIPETATVVYGPAEVEAPISFFKGQSKKIADHVAARLVEIEEERELLREDDIRNLPLFGKTIEGTVPGQKIVFGSKNQIGYAIHSYIPIGDDLFIQHLNSILPEYDRIAIFNRVASHLLPRSEDEVSPGPGTCIEGGFVALDPQRERVTIGIRLKEFPDVHISLDVHKNQKYLAETGRLELMREQAREAAEERGLGAVFARIKMLRHEKRQLGDWKGVEILTRTPAHLHNTEAHEFRYESLGAVHDSLRPHLDIRLDSGVASNRNASVQPSITDDEAIALWDQLLNSIRVRPLKNSSINPGNPVGRSEARWIDSGMPCPQTGWWLCKQEAIDGERRRYFTAGELMPKIILFGEPSLWERLTGASPRFSSTTAWKLDDQATE